MKKRENNILLVVIAVLAVLLIASVSYVIYDIYIKDNKPNQNIENNNDKIQKEEIEEETLKDLTKIINDELYILWDKDDINEITNQEKLQVALLKLTELNSLDHYSNK